MQSTHKMKNPVLEESVLMYTYGVFFLSVCAENDQTPEQVAAWANSDELPFPAKHIDDHPWEAREEIRFSDGPTSPCPCNVQPETRTHYLLDWGHDPDLDIPVFPGPSKEPEKRRTKKKRSGEKKDTQMELETKP